VTASALTIVGRVRRPHGIRGELVVEATTDVPDAVFASGHRVFVGTRDGTLAPDGRTLTVEASRPFQEGWLVRFAGIADRTAAEGWRDRTLLVPRDELPPPGEGEVLLDALVGMRVTLVDGSPVGEVVDFYEVPQGLVLEVRHADGREGTALIPFIDAIVTAVDVERRVVTIDPPDGLLE
jgi:16S rRNA processing protein RimM